MNIMNPPADWSTLKKLIWLRGTPITGGEELTVSGTPPLSLPNSLGKPLKAWEVDLLPKQDLNGYDAPWPAGGGANKLDLEAYIASRTSDYSVDANGWITINSMSRAGLYANSWPVGPFTNGSVLIEIDASRTTATNVAIRALLNGLAVGQSTTAITNRSFDAIAFNWYDEGKATVRVSVVDAPSISSWTPYSNLCPIHGTDKLTITTAGKNLFDQSQIGEASGITLNADGYYTGYRSAWNLAFGAGFPKQPIFKPNTQYTISALGYNSSSASSTQIGFKYTDGTASYMSINSTSPDTFALTSTSGKTLSYILGTFGSEGGITFYIKNIMLVEGTTAEQYEPYNASQTVLTLPQTVYTGTIGSEGGESRCGEVDLGTLTWHSNSLGLYSMGLVGIAKTYPNGQPNHVLFENYQSKPSKVGGTYVNEPNVISLNSNGYLYTSATTTPTGKCVYELIDPVQFAVTSPTIPTPTGTATTWATAEDGTVDGMEVTYVGKA